MASASNNNMTTTMHHSPPPYGSDPSSLDTTFVQADSSTFRTIVQKLTGATDDPSTQKLPITHPNRSSVIPGPKRPAFKLQERRQSAKNLEINLNSNSTISNSFEHPDLLQFRQRTGFLVSPVSTLDFFCARASPRSPYEEFCSRGGSSEEEERAIAEKGFYLHPSPLTTPRGVEPPELLPLFPLRSLRDYKEDQDDDRNSCS
ncbi:hypothetical protein P3X46_034134 [Hevea brasiliensis]|uniref:VQ domain-containing protein n=1 Tax=Hevea brasiliensis TaxID=3981 RepID=A0ABQ9KBT4_HEVBR|nr:VQ motif-containing protein 11-like [Hevea brasiliensis]KAJ9129096.1 hypothetical protein P3X46_034134 [Hevea brasiliensis]